MLSAAGRGHLAMLAFSALVAGSFSFGAMVAPYIEPAAFNAARFLLAGAVLFTVAAIGPGLRRSDFHAPWRYIVLAAFFSFYFVMMFEGLKTATPVSTATVFTLTPLMTAGFAWAILRQVTTRRIALALAVGAAGAVWVIFRADLSALLAFEVGRGEAVYFLGCAAHAVYIPLLRRLNRGEAPLPYNLGILGGCCAILLVAGAGQIATTPWLHLPPVVWVALVYTGLFSSALTFVLIQYASMRLPAAKVMAYTYLTPSWVIAWESALGRPLPPALVLVGVGLTMVALLMLLREDQPAR